MITSGNLKKMNVRLRSLLFPCLLILINIHCFKYTLSDFLNAEGPPPKLGATIKASYATGNVDGGNQNDVGGLVGFNSGSTIAASYSTGTPTSTGSDIGGLVGKNEGTVTASYFDSAMSGITTGDQAQTTSQLQTPTEYGTGTAIYSGWNIDVDSDGTDGFTRGVQNGTMAGDTTADDPWGFGTSSQYPVLKVDFDGDGTAGAAEFGSQR